MAEERDERWVYVALAAIAVGYLVHANWETIVDRVSLRGIGRFTSSIGYLVAPLGAAALALYRRKKAEGTKREWEQQAFAEGIVREEQGVSGRKVDTKGRGTFRADLRLTRMALYVFDRSGRVEPMRLLVHMEAVTDLGLYDVEYEPGRAGGSFTVRVVGKSKFGLRFESAQALGWWTDIRKVLGLPADRHRAPSAEGGDAATPSD